MTAIPFTIDKKTAMLADPIDGDTRGFVMEPKLDGHRFIAAMDGEGDVSRVRMFARSGVDKSGKCPNVEDALQWLPSGTVLDGEIVSLAKVAGGHWGDVQTIMGAQSKVTDKLTYVVFDVLAYNGLDTRDYPLAERRELLVGMFDNYPSLADSTAVTLIEQRPYEAEWAEQLMAEGWEGAIVKDPAGRYVGGRRHWGKIKATETVDVVVLDATDGKGSFDGMIGALVFGVVADPAVDKVQNLRVIDGVTYAVKGKCSGMTIAQRIGFTVQRDNGLIGTVIEVRHMGRMDTGGWRHPQFKRVRTDKLPEECTA